jgi:hypothetical protein
MQINGFSTSPSLPVQRTNMSQPAQEVSDQAVLHVSLDTFSGLVQQAGAMPEVRGEVVDSFKARIQSGQYPSPETVAGLVDVIGGSIVKLASVAAE